MKVLYKPSSAKGRIEAPCSKSMAHRLIICGALSEGKTTIEYKDTLSGDIEATLNCITGLGAKYVYKDGLIEIEGIGSFCSKGEMSSLYCNESGSTLRFLIPIAWALGRETVFHGEGRLMERPLGEYEKLAIARKCEYVLDKSRGTLKVSGRISAGDYEVNGNISSQFISGLLLALPLLDGDSTISIKGDIVSRPYIELTVEALKVFGVTVNWNGNRIYVPGNQKYDAGDMIISVETDYSNAAALDIYNYIGETAGLNSVEITNSKNDLLDFETVQGDKVYKVLFEKISRGKCSVDISECPDLAPLLMVLGAFKEGVVITGTGRLKEKESDRGHAMREELSKVGIEVIEKSDSIEVVSFGICEEHKSAEDFLKGKILALKSHNDHRIVMALSALLSVTGGELDGAEAINKSYPDFFEALKKIGIEYSLL